MQVNKALIIHLRDKFQLSDEEIAEELRYPLHVIRKALGKPSLPESREDGITADDIHQAELARTYAQSPRYAAVEERLLSKIDDLLQEDDLNPTQIRQLVGALKELRQLTPAPQMMPQQQQATNDNNITIQFLSADQLLNVNQ